MKEAVNPFLPSYEYVPDGEPHIFGDRVYLYGSHDKFGGKDYCENDYVCWSASIDNLANWRYEGVIYRKEDDPKQVERKILFAPDVIKGKDGRFYLYYSLAHSSIISVAVCNEPAGKYSYLGDVSLADGRVYGTKAGDYYQFDPAVFMDDDGEIYLYSGFCPRQEEDELGRKYVGCHVSKIEDDYLTMKSEPVVVINRKDDFYDETRYFEAPSMRKFGDNYYLIYSVRLGGLHYMMSKYPDRDFVYKGRLHSTSDVGINGYTADKPAYPNGNTHGSLIKIKNQYYIFDHRYSNASSYSRQAVAEKIYMADDGSFKQVEATSCGLNDGPLKLKGTIPSYIACNLIDGINYKEKEEKALNSLRISQDGPDREVGEDQYVSHIHNTCVIGYKYFELPAPTATTTFTNSSKSTNMTLNLIIRGEAKGKFNIKLIYKNSAYENENICFELNCKNKTWTSFNTDKFPLIEGEIFAIFFRYEGEGEFEFKDFSFKKV